MKLTTQQLKKIIKEELEAARENEDHTPQTAANFRLEISANVKKELSNADYSSKVAALQQQVEALSKQMERFFVENGIPVTKIRLRAIKYGES